MHSTCDVYLVLKNFLALPRFPLISCHVIPETFCWAAILKICFADIRSNLQPIFSEFPAFDLTFLVIGGLRRIEVFPTEKDFLKSPTVGVSSVFGTLSVSHCSRRSPRTYLYLYTCFAFPTSCVFICVQLLTEWHQAVVLN